MKKIVVLMLICLMLTSCNKGGKPLSNKNKSDEIEILDIEGDLAIEKI